MLYAYIIHWYFLNLKDCNIQGGIIAKTAKKDKSIVGSYQTNQCLLSKGSSNPSFLSSNYPGT